MKGGDILGTGFMILITLAYIAFVGYLVYKGVMFIKDGNITAGVLILLMFALFGSIPFFTKPWN
jgi:hypothetical protein